MKDTKRRLEPFSFFDHTGISVHLEKMAAKGWMLEKMTNTGWVYRRIEPKALHFAISYYPKASEFDPEPSEEQRMFHDFCAHTGWKLVCTSAQLQVFCNDRENPTPIETEPELELQAIHASAKKSFIPSYIVLLVCALLNNALWVSSLLGDPIALLSSPTKMFTGLSFQILAILCVAELICYFLWLSRAKATAEHGEFLKVPGTSKFQKAALVVVGAAALYWIISNVVFGDTLQRWVALFMGIYMPALFAIVNAVKEFLKRKKASRGVNRTITMLTSFIIAFGMMGLITFGTLYASSHGLLIDKGEETYEHGGRTWVIHQDELPLVVEDLVTVEYNDYIKERSGDMSLILGQLEMWQRPRLDAKNYADIPQLEYTLTIVRFPALYEMCKERLMYEQEVFQTLDEQEYKAENAAPWGANEAYRLYDPEYGARNDYLLCYDGLLVEIHFDWEPTEEQMAIVGEKLSGNPI